MTFSLGVGGGNDSASDDDSGDVTTVIPSAAVAHAFSAPRLTPVSEAVEEQEEVHDEERKKRNRRLLARRERIKRAMRAARKNNSPRAKEETPPVDCASSSAETSAEFSSADANTSSFTSSDVSLPPSLNTCIRSDGDSSECARLTALVESLRTQLANKDTTIASLRKQVSTLEQSLELASSTAAMTKPNPKKRPRPPARAAAAPAIARENTSSCANPMRSAASSLLAAKGKLRKTSSSADLTPRKLAQLRRKQERLVGTGGAAGGLASMIQSSMLHRRMNMQGGSASRHRPDDSLDCTSDESGDWEPTGVVPALSSLTAVASGAEALPWE